MKIELVIIISWFVGLVMGAFISHAAFKSAIKKLR